MPKHIKTIKCPQCGSMRVTQLREDHYRCDSCSTEFYLDSDDITIHHKIEAERNGSPLGNTFAVRFKRFFLILLAVTIFFSLITVIIGFVTSRSSSDVAPADANSVAEEHMSYRCTRLMTFTSTAGRPIVVLCGAARRDDSTGDWNHAKGFMYFFDGETNEIVRKLELSDVTGGVSVTDARQFEDGTFYFILNKQRLFTIDRSTLDVKEIHGEDYKLPEFSEGFGKVEFYDPWYGDALLIETNLGKELVYYPTANKLYTEETINEAYKEKHPAPKVATHFIFSLQYDNLGEPIQLVRYRTLEQVGYPRYEPQFGWEKYYGESGQLSDDSPYRKIFIRPKFVVRSHLQGYEDFTPGAYYFSPKVLYESSEQVLISFKPTAAADAKIMLRCLDAQTGKVLWSCSEGIEKFGIFCGVAPFSGGCVVVDGFRSWLISSEGKLVSSTDYRKLIEDRS